MNQLKLGVKGVKDILSREELKKVMGGAGSGSGTPQCNCNTSSDCSGTDQCMADCEGGHGAGHCAYSGTSGSGMFV